MRLLVLIACLLCVFAPVRAQRATTEADCLARLSIPPSQEATLLEGSLRRDLAQIAQAIRENRLPDALKQAQALVEEQPEHAGLKVVLGAIYYQQHKIEQAVALFNAALDLDRCNARAHFYAWRLESLGGKTADSRKELEFAHLFAPNDEVIQKTWKTVAFADSLVAEGLVPVVKRESSLREGFFAKSVDCDNIPVLSSAEVDDTALIVACSKVRMMLVRRPDALHRMIGAGSELHIIGDRENTTDMPENRWWKTHPYLDAEGKSTDMDARARGVGGLKSSCGEENLLNLPYDRYFGGFDTCTHEFSHDIMENGFSSKERKEIEQQYRTAVKDGLWKGVYGSVNAKEYWAEISMWYFGAHGTFVPHLLTTAGPDALKAYDPGGYGLADKLYSDRSQ